MKNYTCFFKFPRKVLAGVSLGRLIFEYRDYGVLRKDIHLRMEFLAVGGCDNLAGRIWRSFIVVDFGYLRGLILMSAL